MMRIPQDMDRRKLTAALVATGLASMISPIGVLRAQSGALKIAVLNDMSSVYAEG